MIEETTTTPTEAELERKPQWRIAGIIFFGLLALLLIYAAFLIIWPFMTAILLGAIIVVLTFGLFQKVRTRLKGRSGRAAAVMLLGVTVVIVIPALILAILLVQQANVVVDKLQSGEAQAMIKRVDVTSTRLIIAWASPLCSLSTTTFACCTSRIDTISAGMIRITVMPRSITSAARDELPFSLRRTRSKIPNVSVTRMTPMRIAVMNGQRI